MVVGVRLEMKRGTDKRRPEISAATQSSKVWFGCFISTPFLIQADLTIISAPRTIVPTHR